MCICICKQAYIHMYTFASHRLRANGGQLGKTSRKRKVAIPVCAECAGWRTQIPRTILRGVAGNKSTDSWRIYRGAHMVFVWPHTPHVHTRLLDFVKQNIRARSRRLRFVFLSTRRLCVFVVVYRLKLAIWVYMAGDDGDGRSTHLHDVFKWVRVFYLSEKKTLGNGLNAGHYKYR